MNKIRTIGSRASLCVAGFILFLGPVAVSGGSEQAAPIRITGTYSDMHYIQESGDVLGTEIKIVFTGSTFQGALQIAEGSPGELILVNVTQAGNTVRFEIPDSSQYPGSFAGVIANGTLRGEFHFKGGGESKVVLRKGKSYWD